MLEALLSSLSNVLVLALVTSFGYLIAAKRQLPPEARGEIARIVNLSLPLYLFHSIVSHFTHDALLEIAKLVLLPFLVVALNYGISLLLVRFGFVRRSIRGAFIACFTSSTVLFVGIPMTTALFGDEGIPYLLVYFFANCFFIWTFGIYHIGLDGVERKGGVAPKLFSMKGIKRMFSPPLLGFLIAVFVVLLGVPLPDFVIGTTKTIGAITSPLALVFIGMTIQGIGFAVLKHIPFETFLVILSCYVVRPLLMFVVTMPFDLEPLARQVFVCATALPVSSVTSVMARYAGADDEFVSETIGLSTIALVFALPVLLLLLPFIG